MPAYVVPSKPKEENKFVILLEIRTIVVMYKIEIKLSPERKIEGWSNFQHTVTFSLIVD